jgi:type II secretory ATPase GspE/PulE/Tfp pilus assembly ATPase PilB-like protein
MATFERIQSISISRWDEVGDEIFQRPTQEEIAAYARRLLADQQREQAAASPETNHAFGLLSLFRIFDQVHFRRDSDLLLRHTSQGGAVFLRRDGTFYPVPSNDADRAQPMVLPMDEYLALLNVINTNIVRKDRKPSAPFQGSALLAFAGTDEEGKHHRERISVRISGLPSLGSWSVCFRFIRALDDLFPLNEVYLLQKFQTAIRQELLEQNHGLLLIAGPTNHGKTTAAYAILNELTSAPLRDMRHVLTIEDPIECRLDQTTQVEVNQREGFSFAQAFHEALRHGPEIFFIGEIRSAEAARAAVDAALSGHLTLATIHGGSTFDAISRLIGFGISSRELSAALNGVINHRLVPRLCSNPGCSASIDETDPLQGNLKQWAEKSCWEQPPTADLRYHVPREPQECGSCSGTGRVGRILLASITRNDQAFSDWLREGAARERAPGFRPSSETDPETDPLGFAACASALAMRGLVAVEVAYGWSQLTEVQ